MAESSGSEGAVKVPGGHTEEVMKEDLAILHEQLDSSLLPQVVQNTCHETDVSKGQSVLAFVVPSDCMRITEEVCVETKTEIREHPDSEMKVTEDEDVLENDLKGTELTVAESKDLGQIANSEIENAETAQEIHKIEIGFLTEESMTGNSAKTTDSEVTMPDEKTGQSDADNTEIKELPKEKVDQTSQDAGMTSEIALENSSNPKDDYRQAAEISDSDSEDSDSSSISSLSSPSSDSSSDDCVLIPDPDEIDGTALQGNYPVIRAPGELLPEDLPPIEELHITVPSSLCAEIGVVTSIVQTLVVIESSKGVPALDLDSVLFLDEGARALGAIFDVFGKVTDPMYCVRFNSAEHIAEFNVKPGDLVYYAPQTEHSKYVFLKQLMEMRGSDASRRGDIERGVQVEFFSDDEEERKALAEYGDDLKADDEDSDATKRKRDGNEFAENNKKFAPQFPPRGQRGGGRPQFTSRGRPAYRRHQQRPNQPRHEGPLHPPNFSFPPISMAGTPGPRTNTPTPQNAYPCYPMSQGSFCGQPYQNPPSFGQLPYAQPQAPLQAPLQAPPPVDPRVFQFGAQFAQMVCNLQSSSPSMPMNVPPPVPSFSAPYNQYSGGQNNHGSFYSPSQNQANFSSPFSVPPPNMPPPTGQGFPQHNVSNQSPYGYTYPNYNNGR